MVLLSLMLKLQLSLIGSAVLFLKLPPAVIVAIQATVHTVFIRPILIALLAEILAPAKLHFAPFKSQWL
jgi:hypothetical protein